MRSFKGSHQNIIHTVYFFRAYNEYKMLPRTSDSSCVHAQPSSYHRPSLTINVRGCSLFDSVMCLAPRYRFFV